jgi:CDP-glycerol glycerophosphotransferase (TagB/SpsB family)
MPVYNVERYLAACLDSIVNQTLPDIEIIAVNDGTKDNSLQILKEYESRYPDRMKVFSTENRGVSHARNYGLKRATGEYILFVDSDDFIELDMCEKLYNKATKDNNDIVICGRYNVYEREHIGEMTKETYPTMLINRNFRLSENKYELAHISPFPWDKLFKRSVLEGLEFPEKIRFEDLVLVFEACCKADKIGVIEEPLYNYRRTTQGGFLNTFSEQTLDIVKAFTLVFDFMKKNGYMEIYHDELEYICARHFLYRYPALFKGSNKGKLEIKLKIIRKTQEFLDKEMPDWHSNHYLRYSSGALKAKLKLYTNKNKMIRLTRIREYTPELVAKTFLKFRDFGKKISKKFNKFKKSNDRLSLIKKKLPFLRILMQNGSVYYTKMYEKLSVNPKDILFESKHGEDIAGNIFALMRELTKENYQEYRVYLAMSQSYMEQYQTLLQKYGINNVKMIDIRSKDYVKALASAKFLVTDTSFPPYYIKKKEQVYLNTWHGTPLKAMGRIVPMREYALGNIQRNFMIADYLLYQNDFSRDVFTEDYMLKNIYPGTIMVSGYPRNSIFFHQERYQKIRKEAKLEDKQVIVYMPTWRGLLHKKETGKQLDMLGRYFEEIDRGLTENQVFFVKLHPFVKNEMDYSSYKHIKAIPEQFETYDFLNASDALVTDYSSIMFDYACTKKKMVLFTYDREEYKNGRGLYIDLDTIELPKADTVQELIKELSTENQGYPQFYDRFCSVDSIDTPRQVIETLLHGETKIKENFKVEKVVPNGKKKAFIFIKGLKHDHYSENLINAINEIDTEKFEVYVTMKANKVKKASDMLAKLRKEINYFPLSYDINYTRMDYFLCKLRLRLGLDAGFTNSRVDKVMKREALKYFGPVDFDVTIYQSGLDRMVCNMCILLGKTSVYNFKHFNMQKYKESSAYRSQVKYFVKHFPDFTKVVATKEFDLLKKQADNIIYNEENVFPLANILTEVTQHEGRSSNIS